MNAMVNWIGYQDPETLKACGEASAHIPMRLTWRMQIYGTCATQVIMMWE